MKKYLLGCFALILGFWNMANAAIEEGKEYTRVEPPVIVNTAGDQVEVLEFFSYGCPHCAALAPYFSEWEAKKPANVVIKKIPVEFNPTWEAYAKLYYTAKALKVENKVSPALFDALQNGVDIKNEETSAKIFATYGVSAEKFKTTYHSFSVGTEVNQGRFLVKQYKVSKVPQVVVDGRYRTDVSMAGSQKQLMEVINELIAKVRKERKAQ